MAERVKSQILPGLGRPRIYPWDDWTDGSAWRAEQGKDFQCSVASFRTGLHGRAIRDGLVVATRTDGDAVEFQFYDVEA